MSTLADGGILPGMACLVVDGDELVIRLSQIEQLAAFRGDVHVPLSAVADVSVQNDPYDSLRGFRAPGTGVPGMCAYGVRLLTGGRPDFAALHGRGPGLRVDLGPGAPFGRLLITVDDPAGAVAAVQGGLIRARAV